MGSVPILGMKISGVDRNAGPNGNDFATAFHGKNPVGRWKLSLDDLPAGVNMDDVEDLYLLIRYEYV